MYNRHIENCTNPIFAPKLYRLYSQHPSQETGQFQPQRPRGAFTAPETTTAQLLSQVRFASLNCMQIELYSTWILVSTPWDYHYIGESLILLKTQKFAPCACSCV